MSHDYAVVAVRRAVRDALAGLDPRSTGPVVVACSGGADSLALLSATVAEVARAARAGAPAPRVVGATVDHGLQDGSAGHADRVVAQMAAIGADETLTARVQVTTEGRGPEAAAREARYAVLEQVAASLDAAAVLLGHTLDDQAETVLLGLARGSGGRSVAGMRPGFGPFLRPLLDVRRAETRAYCTAEGLEVWDDPHNEDPRFTRVRVRHRVLPVLEQELGPGVAETLARTAGQLRADTEALDAWAEGALATVSVGDGALDLAPLAGLPPAVRTRVLRAAALRAGSPAAELFHVHVTALDRLVAGRLRGQVQLPGHVTGSLAAGTLRFTPTVVPD
ncbi:tRNA lysidine(34) synthetase TilS [Nocardioides sp. AX2bis]|uniref:tRNA lysidine(34) synthetase TilS n=1 Tax=Nocardioides sp. AX2bis TaxID=2653157 RepID=UPI0012F30ED9|nr:tRNA lysidine(34) synthetase TilS [Nocardioides sp. AX2bis]VXC22997.1 tRNA(Ile)-lysidine synthase [Nocardioides sp. AX2bis]